MVLVVGWLANIKVLGPLNYDYGTNHHRGRLLQPTTCIVAWILLVVCVHTCHTPFGSLIANLNSLSDLNLLQIVVPGGYEMERAGLVCLIPFENKRPGVSTTTQLPAGTTLHTLP